MKVKEFIIEQSKANPQNYILIAVTDENQKFVVAGDYTYSPHLVKYEHSFEVLGVDEHKKLHGLYPYNK